MFGRRQYVIYEKPDPGDIFGSLLAILAIAFVVGMLAIYVGAIVLFIFLGIGGAIGFLYALFIYVRAFINTVRGMSGYSPKSAGVVMGIIERSFAFASMVAAASFHDNLSVASNALARSHTYRLLSFRKWMWLIAALSVVIVGVALIIFFILVQFFIVFAIAVLFFDVFIAICALYITVALFYALYFVSRYAFNSIRNSRLFSAFTFQRGTPFSEMGRAFTEYFSALGRIIKNMWLETIKLAHNNFSSAVSKPLMSLSRWLQLVSPVPLAMLAAVITAFLCIIFAIIFIFLYIAQFFWILLCISIMR